MITVWRVKDVETSEEYDVTGSDESEALRMAANLTEKHPDCFKVVRSSHCPDLDDLEEEYGGFIVPEGDNGDSIVWETPADIADLAEDHIWTLINGDTGLDVVVPGVRRVNRFGFIVTRTPHDESSEVYIYGS